MRKISFTKMVASGNDFVVIALFRYSVIAFKKLAQNICNRKYGVGADGVLFLEKSKKSDVRMRIFNADGSEAEMCGNGARCAALYSAREQKAENRGQKKIDIETKAGIIESQVTDDNVKIRLTEPKDIRIDIPLKVNNRDIKVNFINTGVPHTVIFSEGLEKIDVASLGKSIRYHNKFMPAGTNVNFVEVLDANSIAIRTYERGVEDETLACGTGSVASALITSCKLRITDCRRMNVYTQGGEILKVYFDYSNGRFHNVWLEGKAKIVYEGEYYV